MTKPPTPDFTPALGPRGSIGLYDHVIALLTREKQWRAKLFAALAPENGETIVDIGAGTASMAILIGFMRGILFINVQAQGSWALATYYAAQRRRPHNRLHCFKCFTGALV